MSEHATLTQFVVSGQSGRGRSGAVVTFVEVDAYAVVQVASPAPYEGPATVRLVAHAPGDPAAEQRTWDGPLQGAEEQPDGDRALLLEASDEFERGAFRYALYLRPLGTPEGERLVFSDVPADHVWNGTAAPSEPSVSYRRVAARVVPVRFHERADTELRLAVTAEEQAETPELPSSEPLHARPYPTETGDNLDDATSALAATPREMERWAYVFSVEGGADKPVARVDEYAADAEGRYRLRDDAGSPDAEPAGSPDDGASASAGGRVFVGDSQDQALIVSSHAGPDPAAPVVVPRHFFWLSRPPLPDHRLRWYLGALEQAEGDAATSPNEARSDALATFLDENRSPALVLIDYFSVAETRHAAYLEVVDQYAAWTQAVSLLKHLNDLVQSLVQADPDGLGEGLTTGVTEWKDKLGGLIQVPAKREARSALWREEYERVAREGADVTRRLEAAADRLVEVLEYPQFVQTQADLEALSDDEADMQERRALRVELYGAVVEGLKLSETGRGHLAALVAASPLADPAWTPGGADDASGAFAGNDLAASGGLLAAAFKTNRKATAGAFSIISEIAGALEQGRDLRGFSRTVAGLLASALGSGPAGVHEVAPGRFIVDDLFTIAPSGEHVRVIQRPTLRVRLAELDRAAWKRVSVPAKGAFEVVNVLLAVGTTKGDVAGGLSVANAVTSLLRYLVSEGFLVSEGSIVSRLGGKTVTVTSKQIAMKLLVVGVIMESSIGYLKWSESGRQHDLPGQTGHILAAAGSVAVSLGTAVSALNTTASSAAAGALGLSAGAAVTIGGIVLLALGIGILVFKRTPVERWLEVHCLWGEDYLSPLSTGNTRSSSVRMGQLALADRVLDGDEATLTSAEVDKLTDRVLDLDELPSGSTKLDALTSSVGEQIAMFYDVVCKVEIKTVKHEEYRSHPYSSGVEMLIVEVEVGAVSEEGYLTLDLSSLHPFAMLSGVATAPDYRFTYQVGRASGGGRVRFGFYDPVDHGRWTGHLDRMEREGSSYFDPVVARPLRGVGGAAASAPGARVAVRLHPFGEDEYYLEDDATL